MTAVTNRALIQRIRGALAEHGMSLRVSRGAAQKEKRGLYYTTDCLGRVDLVHVDLHALGYELGVLRPDEVIA